MNGKTLFSKLDSGRFPETKEAVEFIRPNL